MISHFLSIIHTLYNKCACNKIHRTMCGAVQLTNVSTASTRARTAVHPIVFSHNATSTTDIYSLSLHDTLPNLSNKCACNKIHRTMCGAVQLTNVSTASTRARTAVHPIVY